MEAVAAFVFASDGVVTSDELARFLTRHAPVETAFYAAASPMRQLKKIVRLGGAAHGLTWLDATADHAPSIAHSLTDTQRAVFPRTIVKFIPKSLDALAAVLSSETKPLTLGKATHLLTAQFPTEAAFVKSRSGSLQQFVKRYDPAGIRIGMSDTELWLVESSASATRRGFTTTTVSSTSTASEEEDQEKEEQLSLVIIPTPSAALQALRVVVAVVGQTRVFRSPFSPSLSVLIFEVWRLATRPGATSITLRKAPPATPAVVSVPLLTTAPPRATSPPRCCDPHQLRRRRRRRLLVPSDAQGLTWTWIAHGAA